MNSCLVSQLNTFLGHLRSHERCNQERFSPQAQCFACRLSPLFWKLQFNWENSAKSRWLTSRPWQVEKRNAQHSAGKVNVIRMTRELNKGSKNCGEKQRSFVSTSVALASTPVKRPHLFTINWNIGVSVCGRALSLSNALSVQWTLTAIVPGIKQVREKDRKKEVDLF